MEGKKLTGRQREVLEFIEQLVAQRGYPPSVREIGEHIGLRSSATVHSHLNSLEQRGYIRRDPTKPRAIEILLPIGEGRSAQRDNRVKFSPIVGRVTAGSLTYAEQDIQEYLPLPAELVKDQETFVLRVKGDSMIKAGILDGDFLVVRRQNFAQDGDIVVALVDDEATVKRFYRETHRIRLQPENDNMEPLFLRDVSILGVAIALHRRL
ncbi:transcriptional repressor LexA [Candidatus Hakubella thermalkaliphila]|uniref:LexA repressor n=1 Tax=Candidatus Hakubella thermalkaliphila TaxID=2754717 RepID=A0A6V8P7U7_9ACTN|nr:transcriptional repressor LexA [Candidatus Hakubella thermalkaliphila]GFP27081.1 repressor LexA [Candidatus Hakubella thermalkaliphila]